MPSPTSSRLKPPALHRGDTIGIVAPASNVNRADLEAGCEALRRAGYKPIYSESILDQDLYFAGSVERRAHELEDMFEREDVKAILCARGGYGSNYLLDAIEIDKIKRYPKIFIGYSDLTTLLTYFLDVAGLVIFHGPMAAKDWARDQGVDMASWQAALSGASAWDVGLNAEAVGFIDGESEGVLDGGCLSILVAGLGTPYEIDTAGKVLFLEDVAAKPFQIDRMLMQLRLAGKFQGVRGIIFGEMLNCTQPADQDYTLQEVVRRVVGDLGIPVAYSVRSGHVTSGNITLPFGVQARLVVQSNHVGLTILESATL